MKTFLDLRQKKRILFIFAFVCILFIALVCKLVYIQGFKAVEYGNKQSAMLMQRLPITASRGDIYDRNMALLAKDATCSSIYVSPASVDKDKKKEVSEYLAKMLDLKYEDVYKKVSNASSNNELIKRKVDNSVGLKIKNKGYNGVSVTEDKKRYYSNGKFASHLLGFTGVDHQGLYGLEASYNDVLAGKDGVVLYQTDGSGRKIASGSEVRQEATNGSNLVLSIDSVIQMYAENAIETGIKKTGSKRVMALAMDPSTGEILAMATNPSYNLNDPWKLDNSFKKKMSSEFYKTTKSGKKKKMTDSEKLALMWDNPNISLNYEPGSTFKPVTVSSALEEGSIDKSSRFYCKGYKVVAGTKIRCSVYPNGHGSQSLGETLANSCNPAMMEIAMRMGPDTFYDYIYNFGFGSKTGISLGGEEGGIVPPNQDVNVVDFVTKAFGQGISTTPIQMMMALSSTINGGYLLKPQLVKYVTEGEDNTVTTTYEKEVVRQIISKDTSSTMRKYLRGVITKSEVLKKYDTKSLKMGGKTGTAQKIVDGKYSHSKYVCSFFGFAPYNDPKIAVIVLCDEPTNGRYGSTTAAPIASEILKNSVNYLKTKSDDSSKDIKTLSTKVVVPDVRGESLTDAKSLLDTLKIKYKVNYKNKKVSDDNAVVVSQTNVQETYSKTITLTVDDSSSENVTMPDLTGMSVQSANEALTKIGLTMEIEGGGIVQSQSVKAGTSVKKGTKVTVTFKYVK